MTARARSLPLVAVVLAVAILVINVRVIAGGMTWDDIRYHTEVAPPRLAAADSVQHGAWPAWWEGTGLGVPLAAEPTHGALYPLGWVAASPRALDLVLLLHLVWAALGIAIWARRRTVTWAPDGASEPAALVVGLLAVTSGLFASLAIRGALPAIAHLPWIGVCASALAGAARPMLPAAGLALLLGLVGLTGTFGVLVDAVLVAVVLGARRGVLRDLAVAVAGGLAIAAAQWVPAALQLGEGAHGEVHGLALSRLLELIVPGGFGADDPSRGIEGVAGAHAWAPSVFVGAPLLALAAVRTPPRRIAVLLAAFAVLALVGGRGGWPAWLGAPELHLAALVVVLAAHAAPGFDALLAAERRALVAVAAGIGCSVVAMGALAAYRGQHPDAAPAIERALLDGALGVICVATLLVVCWRRRGRGTAIAPLVLALLVLPSAGALRSTAPTIDRDVVVDASAWADAARAAVRADAARGAPLRVFRPVFLSELPAGAAGPGRRANTAATQAMRDAERIELGEAVATFAGASAARWGIAAARSEDPARHAFHDQLWLAASREGGALLDRFGIELAILPASLIVPRKLTAVSTRGGWSLVALPVAPPAAVLRGALWSRDATNSLDLLFPAAGGSGVLRGTVVLHGAGQPSQPDRGPPLPCTIDRWDPGAIDVTCTTDVAGYAVVSSTAAAGWHATVDGRDAAWLTADVIRRAVAIAAGTHRISWRYSAPGSSAGLVAAVLGIVAAIALFVLARRAPR